MWNKTRWPVSSARSEQFCSCALLRVMECLLKNFALLLVSVSFCAAQLRTARSGWELFSRALHKILWLYCLWHEEALFYSSFHYVCLATFWSDLPAADRSTLYSRLLFDDRIPMIHILLIQDCNNYLQLHSFLIMLNTWSFAFRTGYGLQFEHEIFCFSLGSSYYYKFRSCVR